MRAGPSGEAEVLSVLRRGLAVAVVEESGNWRRIRIAAAATGEPQEGWVFRTFLDESRTPPVQAAELE
jgi:SH3-like domain-containing protein